ARRPLSPPKTLPRRLGRLTAFTCARLEKGGIEDGIRQGESERLPRRHVTMEWRHHAHSYDVEIIFQKISAAHVLAQPMGLECCAIEYMRRVVTRTTRRKAFQPFRKGVRHDCFKPAAQLGACLLHP